MSSPGDAGRQDCSHRSWRHCFLRYPLWMNRPHSPCIYHEARGKHMSSTETAVPRQHASTGPAQPQPPEPSHAERVRTLLSLTSVGTLSTLSRKHPGFPFGSLMPFAIDSAGQPIFLISNMAMHTQNLKDDPRCSLFIGQAVADGDPLGAARATLIGLAEPVQEHEISSVRE